MKNVITLLAFFACVLYVYPVSAQGPGHQPSYEKKKDVTFDEERKKVTMVFAGQDEEKGMLELFVGTNMDKTHINTPIEDNLKMLSPAAGVQFRLEF